jgi:hypothetical protein
MRSVSWAQGDSGGVAIATIELETPSRVTHLAFRNRFASQLSIFAHFGHGEGDSGVAPSPSHLKETSPLMRSPHAQDDALSCHCISIFSPGIVHQLLLRASQPSPRFSCCSLPRLEHLVVLNDPNATDALALKLVRLKRLHGSTTGTEQPVA